MKTVLVVDDDTDTTDLYGIVLMGAGLHVLVAHSMQEAVEIAYSNKIDLLLTDLFLPDGKGKDLPHLMGKRAPKSAILVTGQDPTPWKEGPDFHDYLLKPVDMNLLCKTVKSCLDLHKAA